jgi:hypothetical protein
MPDLNPRDPNKLLKPPTKGPMMRAAKPHERIGDFFRDIYESAAAQPLGRIADATGITNLSGMIKTAYTPDTGVKLGMMPGPPGSKLLSGLKPTAFSEADEVERLIRGMGNDNVSGLQHIDDVSGIRNNASGTGMDSIEALSRNAGMKTRGEQFVVRKGGTTRPLIGPEAVDYTPRRGEEYGILNADGTFRLLNRGL